MQKFTSTIFDYTYDPEVGDSEYGVSAGAAWEDLPDDWVCPVCGADKDMFETA